MTNKQFHAYRESQRLSNLHKSFSYRSFPSRRQSHSTSHGNMDIKEKGMRIIPGVGLETQLARRD
jgi:hypothetical protein